MSPTNPTDPTPTEDFSEDRRAARGGRLRRVTPRGQGRLDGGVSSVGEEAPSVSQLRAQHERDVRQLSHERIEKWETESGLDAVYAAKRRHEAQTRPQPAGPMLYRNADDSITDPEALMQERPGEGEDAPGVSMGRSRSGERWTEHGRHGAAARDFMQRDGFGIKRDGTIGTPVGRPVRGSTDADRVRTELETATRLSIGELRSAFRYPGPVAMGAVAAIVGMPRANIRAIALELGIGKSKLYGLVQVHKSGQKNLTSEESMTTETLAVLCEIRDEIRLMREDNTSRERFGLTPETAVEEFIREIQSDEGKDGETP